MRMDILIHTPKSVARLRQKFMGILVQAKRGLKPLKNSGSLLKQAGKNQRERFHQLKLVASNFWKLAEASSKVPAFAFDMAAFRKFLALLAGPVIPFK